MASTGCSASTFHFFDDDLPELFFAEDFLAEDFFDEDFFDGDVFEEDFFEEDFFADDFFADDFFEEDLPDEDEDFFAPLDPLRPLPDFLPPPDCLFTVAQARRSASFSETPRSS